KAAGLLPGLQSADHEEISRFGRPADRIDGRFLGCHGMSALFNFPDDLHRRSDHRVRPGDADPKLPGSWFIVLVAEAPADAGPVGNVKQRAQTAIRVGDFGYNTRAFGYALHEISDLTLDSVECAVVQIEEGEVHGCDHR